MVMRVAVVGVGIEAGVVAGRDRHLGQLLDGRAELVHVPAGHHGVVRAHRVAEGGGELDGAPGPEGEVGHAQLLLQVGPLRRSVGEDDDVDLALGDGGRGVLDDELPDAPAVPGRVDPVGAADRGTRPARSAAAPRCRAT